MTPLGALAPRAAAPTLIGVGGVAWSGDPSVVYSTLLGSCIAVCLHDPEAGKGGMNHFLLAEAPAPSSNDTRYGSVSLPLLLRNLEAVGCRKERMVAVLAGGADVLSNLHKIGTENADYAIAWLRREAIEIGHRDYGAREARRVRFVPATGQCAVTSITHSGQRQTGEHR